MIVGCVSAEGGLGPNADSGVDNRPIPYEPMYILFNLAISENFGAIDYAGLAPLFPLYMDVDYVRPFHFFHLLDRSLLTDPPPLCHLSDPSLPEPGERQDWM